MTKIALITGANKGIGFETARQLAKSGGVHVLLGSRDHSKGVDAALKLQGEGLDVTALALDVTDPASIAAAAQAIERRLRRARAEEAEEDDDGQPRQPERRAQPPRVLEPFLRELGWEPPAP